MPLAIEVERVRETAAPPPGSPRVMLEKATAGELTSTRTLALMLIVTELDLVGTPGGAQLAPVYQLSSPAAPVQVLGAVVPLVSG